MARTKDQIGVIRLSPFSLKTIEHVDIRYWTWTMDGPRPTKKGVAIRRSEVIPLIIALQKVESAWNSDDARMEAARKA